MMEGEYSLCYSSDILLEYEEIIGQLASPTVARNVVHAIEQSPFTIRITPYYHFDLITADPDDNKFVDCTIAANATYIVSEDRHFKVLEHTPFPKLNLLSLEKFLEVLKG